MKKALVWLWRNRKRSLALAVAFVFVLLNVLAFVHARAMTHFAPSGAKTLKPEALSRWGKLKVLLTGVNIPRPMNDADPATVGLGYTIQRMERDDGTMLEAWEIAHPKARGRVLLFHGYASCKASLLREARVFHSLGYTVCLVDFRGSGGSAGDVTTVGVREADDVAAAFAQLRQDGKPCMLYGQSMGSAAILRAVAVHGLQPDALIIECPFDTLRNTVAARFDAMGMPAFPGADLLVFWGGVQQGFNGFTHRPVDYARAVSCPVLLMHGTDDPRVTPVQLESIYENLAGPKELQWFVGAGHVPCCTANPDRWTRSVASFLDEVLVGQ